MRMGGGGREEGKERIRENGGRARKGESERGQGERKREIRSCIL